MPTCTQAGVVTSSLTNVAASSYSYVAGFTTHSVATTHTINITTHNVGNLLVSMPSVAGTVGGYTLTAPSGTGTTAWADSGEAGVVSGNSGIAMWTGRVSAVGATTLTVPFTATGGTTCCLQVYEFTCPGVDSGTVWTVDAHGKVSYAAGTLVPSYPFLSPTSSAFTPEIYVGGMTVNDIFISPGNTPGFSYVGSGSADVTIGAFNVNNTGPISPNATGSASDTQGYNGIATLIRATIAKAIFDNIRIYLPPITTGRMWIISQIGFEFLPANTLQTITANIVLNGRVVKPGINPNAGQFQGPPYITVRAGDTMWVDLFGVPVGASAVANFLYNEYSAYAVPHDLGGVV